MPLNCRSVALVACLALGAASQAHASDQLVTYVGVVTAGTDIDSLFDQAGADLTGEAFRADIVYSTDVPGTRTTLAGTAMSPPSDEVSGGESFLTDPVILSAAFTIGGSIFSFSPPYYGDVYTSPTFLDAYGYDLLGDGFQTYILPSDGAAPANLETAFVATGAGDANGPISQFSFLSDGTETIDFDSTSVRVSAAPEPAAWALLIAGLGVIGLVFRGRRFAAHLA